VSGFNLAWSFGVTIEWPKVLWHFSVLVNPWTVYCRCLLLSGYALNFWTDPPILVQNAPWFVGAMVSHKSISHSVSLITKNPSWTLWLLLANIPYSEPLLLALHFFTMSLD
jgi:hypothetical protein